MGMQPSSENWKNNTTVSVVDVFFFLRNEICNLKKKKLQKIGGISLFTKLLSFLVTFGGSL